MPSEQSSNSGAPVKPWLSFLKDLDDQFTEETIMHRMGGFAVVQAYGLNLRENGGEAIMPEKLLTIDEAADLLNVRREFITALLNEGALPFVGHGFERQVFESIFLAYRNKRNAERHEAIKRMARADVEAGVYDLVILPEGAED